MSNNFDTRSRAKRRQVMSNNRLLARMLLMPKSQSGQTAVFVFILLLVGLTIGISLSTRTIKDLSSSTSSDLSSRAFAAAEAGVEDALRQSLSTLTASGTYTSPATAITTNNTQFTYTVAKSPVFTQTVSQDLAVQINTTGVFGNVQIFWVATGDATENTSRASLELTLVKNTGGSYSITKYAVNGDARSNNFTNPGGTDGPVTNQVSSSDQAYHNQVTIALPAGIEAIRIRPMYNKSSLKVTGTGLPSQSFVITSRGVAANAVTRVVEVTRAIPALPAIFDYVLFNGSTNPLSK